MKNIGNETGIKFITKQIMKNRIIGIGFRPYSSSGTGHASLIKEFKYLADYSKFRMTLINPGESQRVLKSFKSIYQMYGLWRK